MTQDDTTQGLSETTIKTTDPIVKSINTEADTTDYPEPPETDQPDETLDIGQVISALLTEYHEPTEPTNAQLRDQLAIGDLIISKVSGSHLIILTQSQLDYSRDILRTFPSDSSSYLLLKERVNTEPQGPDESPETET
jgi:hypothetical protein